MASKSLRSSLLTEHLDLRKTLSETELAALVRTLGDVQRTDWTLTSPQLLRAMVRHFLSVLGASDGETNVALVRRALSVAPGGIL